MLFTKDGIINIRNLKWENDFSPIEKHGFSFVDEQYSKAYLRHLIISKELLGAQIATLHNLSFYIWLVNEAKERIKKNNFDKWKNSITKKISTRL